MDRQAFLKRADACIGRVVAWLEAFDPDEVDFSEADGVVTIEFADGTKFVLNRQAGSHQMWYAAGVRAWHYDWNDEAEQWCDSRDGHVLEARIAESVSEKLGRTVTFG